APAQWLGEGARVWVPDAQEVWKPAELTKGYEEGDGCLHLRLQDGSELTCPVGPQLPFLRNPDYLSGENDLVALSYLHEPAVLHTLRARFLETNTIYTYCGIILVAINPYKPLPIYEEPVIYAYSGQCMGDMDPHIFAVAEEAYRQMSRYSRDQSLIISGESGAGKTASAKYAMRYFATVGGSLSDAGMEEKVLAASPIMEAFGNAKTTRNDNSSRFGKYVEICFNHEYRIVGAAMKTYLLEKSRLTFQAKAERNYHIFYQLCASAALPEFHALRLGEAESFHYIKQGRCALLEATDDAADLESTRNAFSLLGVHESNQLELFSILAAILHLGNIRLKAKDRHGESCFLEPEDEALGRFCTLLGVEKSQASRWLCYRKLVTASETYVKPLSRQQASTSRDALAKHLYGQLFKWIVSRINKALRASCRPHASIGILDIYGFETFAVNSFEQFCINYANEKLQQHFNLHVFKLEQEEYVREGIPWAFIDFSDNQPCIDLIEAKLGILDLLNEECKMPKGSDRSWAQKLYDQHLHHSPHFQKPKMSTEAFIIQHFAGKVEYQCRGFLEKNQDMVPAELIGLLRASKSALLAELFPEEGDGSIALPSRLSHGSRVTVRPSRRSLPATDKEHRKPISTQFKASLHKLMETLACTTPHYIRCIKPNDHKRPFEFDARRVVEQLRACGVLETIQISASGYPSRWTYAEFFGRYRALMRPEDLTGGDEKKTCWLVLQRLLKDSSKFQCGKGKIFFRAGQVAFLEELRGRRLRAACVLIQKSLRGWLGRRRFLRMRAAAICLQRLARGFLARRLARRLRRASAALKMALARRSYRRTHAAAVTIQAFARGMFARRLHRQCDMNDSFLLVPSWKNGGIQFTLCARARRAVVYLQCCYRRMQARRELRRLRIEAKSVEHYKQLSKGMEIKVVQLQCKVDEQARENQSLSEQLSALRASHGGEGERLGGVQRLQEDKAQERHVRELQEQLQHMELEKSLSEGRLGRELQELKQRLAELEAMKSNLKEEKDALNQRIMEQSQDLEEQLRCVRGESQELLGQLEGERTRYQSLVTEYARLEQHCENLQDEVAFHKKPDSISALEKSQPYVNIMAAPSMSLPLLSQSPHGMLIPLDLQLLYNASLFLLPPLQRTPSLRRSPSSDSILDSKGSYPSSLSTAPSWEDTDQQSESPSQPLDRERGPWKSRAMSDSPRSSITDEDGQDPLEKAYLLLLGQLNAVTEDLARTREELRRAKAQLAHERKPFELFKRWVRLALLRVPRCVISFPRQNAAEILGLSKSPEKMIEADSLMEEDLKYAYDAVQVSNKLLQSQLQEQQQQHEQELEGLCLDIRSLKQLSQQQQSLIQDLQQHQEEDGLLHQLVQLKRENLDLAEQLERQERSMLQLRKQLKASMKQIQDLTGAVNREAMWLEHKVKAEEAERPLGVLRPARALEGMLGCKAEDEGRLIRAIITDFKPQHHPDALPGLPAYVLFMCLRHADSTRDEHRIRSLFAAAISGIKRAVKKHSEDVDVVTLWLANTCCLINCLRQYGWDQ
uniref:MYO5B protein n=1 Tax=Pelodiscus sinensis TaxID=13735 RepID=K7F9J3_PELSI